MNTGKEARILIIKWGALGDIVMSTSAIRTIRENFPEAKITLLSNSLMEQILPEGFLYDELIKIKTKGNRVNEKLSSLLKLIIALRKRKFDLAVNLRWTSERAAMFAYLSGAKHRVSSGPKNVMKLYTIQTPPSPDRYHEIHRNLDIVKSLGLVIKDEIPTIFVSEKNEEYADRVFFEKGLKKTETVCLHPGASRANRAWLPDRFREIAKRLSEQNNTKVIITWGKDEEELAKKVAEGLNKNVVVCDRTESIGDLSAIIKNSKMFFSNCTGPMNIAVAVRTPVVALLGSSHPVDWGPYGEDHRIIKSPLVLEHYSEEDERKAMEEISVDSVWEIVKSRWDELREGEK